MVCVGSVLIQNVFATTLTGLPDIPYWRAGDTLDMDCMVYVSTVVSAKYRKAEKIQNAEVQDGGQENGWVVRE
jgi:hypothetical protein